MIDVHTKDIKRIKLKLFARVPRVICSTTRETGTIEITGVCVCVATRLLFVTNTRVEATRKKNNQKKQNVHCSLGLFLVVATDILLCEGTMQCARHLLQDLNRKKNQQKSTLLFFSSPGDRLTWRVRVPCHPVS